ncbi:efflux RND transporter periplasmic adaptor subunit [Paenibacillus contaminans]|uniref:efflux RND transporter periplasmic adaptor subunit n=1 Tax=Paenibacillus contaminans TaxID=450362 RepID=UPI00131424AF|nr:efflux RND transporter periplasmic adaptor subunit [Paenibacillus contaminans]
MGKKRRNGTKAGTILAAMLLMSGCGLIPVHEEAKPELLPPVKDKVELLEVSKGHLSNEIHGTGVIVPANTEFVKYTIDGKIASVQVKAGDRVKKGDVLMTLDPQSLELDLKKQQLALEAVRVEMDKVRSGDSADETKIAVMNVQIEEMRLAGMEARKEKLKLIAPIDGVVTFVDFLRPGDRAVAYQDVVGIANEGALQVRYSTPQGSLTNLTEIEKGMPVELTVRDQTVTGVVKQSPSSAPFTLDQAVADQNARTLLFEFDSVSSDFAFGDNVHFKLVLAEKNDVVKIPRVALRSYQGRDFVHIIEGENRKEVDVVKGLVTSTEVEIKKGLAEGQQIIMNR